MAAAATPGENGEFPLGRIAGILGGATGALTINALSDDFGYRGVAVVGAVAAVLSAIAFLRKFSTRAPLVRLAAALLLAAALAATVAATFGPATWQSFAALAAALMAIAAVVISARGEEAAVLLLATGCIGSGVAAIGAGIAFSQAYGEANPIILLGGIGVGLILFGIGAGQNSKRTAGAGMCAIGLSVVGAASPPLGPADSVAIPLLALGVASVIAGLSDLIGNSRWVAVAFIVGGLGGLAYAIGEIAQGDVAFGVPLIVISLSLSTWGFSLWRANAFWSRASLLGTSLGMLLAGIGMLGENLVLGAAGMVIGMSGLAYFGFDRSTSIAQRWDSWWAFLTSADGSSSASTPDDEKVSPPKAADLTQTAEHPGRPDN